MAFMKPILSRNTCIWIYVLALHMLVLLLVFKTNFLTLAGKTLGWVPAEEWSLSVLDQMLTTAERARHSPKGAVLLLGDSLVVNLGEPNWPIPVVNAGLGGDTTRTLARRLATLQTFDSASAWIVGVGVNDFKYRTTQTIALDYKSLLDRFPVDRPLFIIGVFPVLETGTAARNRSYLQNAAFHELNHELRLQCQRRLSCQYVDPLPIVGNHNGEFESANFQEDGWHLSRLGANAVNTALARRLGFPSP